MTQPTERDHGGMDDVGRLEVLMRAQLEGHERLATSFEAKREAIRTADIDRISALCRQEHPVVQRLGDLEKQRLVLLGRMTETLSPCAARPLTVREIAAATDPARGAALVELAERLRERITMVQRLSAVVRSASESLHRHLTGIMQTVQAALSGTATYEQRGRIAVGAPIEHCVDMKS